VIAIPSQGDILVQVFAVEEADAACAFVGAFDADEGGKEGRFAFLVMLEKEKGCEAEKGEEDEGCRKACD
jgi:hypothetical protein